MNPGSSTNRRNARPQSFMSSKSGIRRPLRPSPLSSVKNEALAAELRLGEERNVALAADLQVFQEDLDEPRTLVK